MRFPLAICLYDGIDDSIAIGREIVTKIYLVVKFDDRDSIIGRKSIDKPHSRLSYNLTKPKRRATHIEHYYYAERSRTRFQILESIIDPNAEVDDKYLTTQIDTLDGKKIMGLLVKETKDEVEIFDPITRKLVVIKAANIDTKKKLKQSSMPEGLAATISPGELLDLLAFLNSLK